MRRGQLKQRRNMIMVTVLLLSLYSASFSLSLLPKVNCYAHVRKKGKSLVFSFSLSSLQTFFVSRWAKGRVWSSPKPSSLSQRILMLLMALDWGLLLLFLFLCNVCMDDAASVSVCVFLWWQWQTEGQTLSLRCQRFFAFSLLGHSKRGGNLSGIDNSSWLHKLW